MLDCPILLDREVLGVICCEQFEIERTWSLEDALFVQSLSDFIALGSQNERIKKLMTQIRQQNFHLVEKNYEIGALNEEFSMVNEQLAELNKNLEDNVRARTSELETQNRQLTEYAFINSHLLRAPLARILGLSQLVVREVHTVKERELLLALESSAHELDQIIRKISELLYEGNNFSRQDINDIIHRQLDQHNVNNK
jgi:GAF domain-containing protein